MIQLSKAIFTATVFLSLLLFVSCGKASTDALDEMIDSSTPVTSIVSGDFSGAEGQNVSGQAKIFKVNNGFQLKLENFRTDNGPDLKVYLSKSGRPDGFISLGDIKSTNGNQVYDIPGNPDFKVHRFVLIHCERFNHLFGRDEMK